jgi:hypothetical protein
MAAPRIHLPPTNDASKMGRKTVPSPSLGWEILGWVGLAFFLIGALDLAMGWVPLRLGNPEWEFGTVSRTFDNLPITALGLTLLLASAAARGVDWAIRAAGLIALLLALFLFAGFVIYLLDVPVAFRAVGESAARSGLKRAVTKALVQGLLYPIVLAAVGIKGIRLTLAARPRLS